MIKVLNLFGGPGVGKSKVRAYLFAMMKDAGINVEETTEFAKDLTWDGNNAALADQLYILGNQNRRLFRLKNKVDWVVTDAPLLLGVHYASLLDPELVPKSFNTLAIELWNSYENYNFVINRTRPYRQVGRKQIESEARQIDKDIYEMLINNNISFVEVNDSSYIAKEIFEKLFGYLTTK